MLEKTEEEKKQEKRLEEMKPLVYIISDSIGETAEFVVNAVASQFNSGEVKMRREPFLTDVDRLRKVVKEASQQNSMIAYTLVLPELRKAVVEEAEKYEIPYVDVMGPMLEAFSRVMPVDPRLEPGLIRRLDEDYFKRVAAIEYAVKNDDGKNPSELLHADVVLIGVSRTSKTPLSMYLANRRLKVANLPIVPEIEPPQELYWLPSKKIVGLTIDPEILREIRLERLNSLGLKNSGSNYADMERIQEELEYARRIMMELRCHIFDVSNKAVEEVTEKILKMVKENDKNG